MNKTIILDIIHILCDIDIGVEVETIRFICETAKHRGRGPENLNFNAQHMDYAFLIKNYFSSKSKLSMSSKNNLKVSSLRR
jgi:hypothetical protein